jgi:hypothetical protein
MALALPPRHARAQDLADDLGRYKVKGYTGIYLENDYLRWTWEPEPGQAGHGNFRLFNLFDFTLSPQRRIYQEYLEGVCGLCRGQGLDVYASFWLPMLSREFLAWLEQQHPDAIGSSTNGAPTLCMCSAGGGLSILSGMVEQFMRDFPGVRGMKVATEDNDCLVCDEHCPHARGTSRARHAANLFACVEQAMGRTREGVKLLLYPWFWGAGYLEEILSRLQSEYLVVTKMEMGSAQKIEQDIPGEPIFDDSIVSGQAGPPFLDWIKRVGADRIIDMVPTGTGIDDFFLANPPYPGRLYRRFHLLSDHGVRRFLDFECGGHCPGGGEETVALFNADPELEEEPFLAALAERMYRRPPARPWAVRGWQAFDRGFGQLPIGIGGTGIRLFSGRFGFAWSVCIATPLVQSLFDGDRWQAIHFFSPYNFFSKDLSPRLEMHFLQVLAEWEESSRCLATANALEGETPVAVREAVSAKAHTLSVLSVLNWCTAAKLAGEASSGTFKDLCRLEVERTQEFADLCRAHPWIWDNNCWHPQQTPLSQRGVGYDSRRFRNAFEAKLAVMRAAL